MEDRQFLALLLPLALLIFLGLPALVLRSLGPELPSTEKFVSNRLAAAQLRQAELAPLCSATEELTYVRRLKTATHSNELQPAVEKLWACWLGERGGTAREILEGGAEMMEAGQQTEAAAVFESTMARYPGWAEAINKLATARYLQGELTASAALCRDVLAIKPHHFGAMSGLVQVLIGLGQLEEAERVAEQLQEVSPKMVRSQANYCCLCHP